ncbi:MAG TPA: thioredoxin domain-containing protein [Thermoanaerobaculia bacterium]|nr:thioredoxin domain-containing protein [Thermoanaerobaculia bacterium]
MSGSSGASNRLAKESSPYLRLHGGNPVDWYPWGAEAIERARREDKPIFLSVGYSTCYWCHVMERESFSDPGIAAEMNRSFVNVKVDREERPDLDEIYMLATQMLTGQGGWPNSVFLTPGLEPFFAGTYFPPEDGHGRPGFPTVLRSLEHAWRERRGDVETQAAEVAGAIRRHLDEVEPLAGPLPGADLAERALDGLRQRFDPTWGGFGEAPKFPTPGNLWLLEDLAAEDAGARMMLTATLDAMARGGIYDQVAGGFHRYATDREWRIPHFEKMLYDNGLLLGIYAREHARSGSAEAARVAAGTAGFLVREMTAPEGGLWSALDAEVAGHEGGHHVWRRRELEAALGAEDAAFLAPILGFEDEPFFEGEFYVLHLARPLEVLARERRTSRQALAAEIEPLLEKLREARARRPRPATDDKILADWNGTAVGGLAEAGRALARPDLVAHAARAAGFVLGTMRTAEGTLLHAWRAGEGRIEAFLADYVFLIHGLLRLAAASGDERWVGEAARLQEEQEGRLGSPRGGYFNAAERDDLLSRAKEGFDGAMPSANGVAALNLLELHRGTGEARWLDAAERTLRAFAPLATTHPDGARTVVLALTRLARTRAEQPGSASGAGRRSSTKREASTEGEGGLGAAAAPADAPGASAIASSKVEWAGESGEGGLRPFLLRLVLRIGWHLEAGGSPPVLEGLGCEVADVRWPEATEIGPGGGTEALRGFEGEIEVRGRARADSPRPALRLRFVACGEGLCHPPAALELPLP